MSTPANKPEKRFHCGPVAASIWAQNKTVNGEEVTLHSIHIDKAYKDGDQWKHTTSFAAEDLPKVALLANEAYRYLRLRSADDISDPDS
jgi:hypothetical protein